MKLKRKEYMTHYTSIEQSKKLVELGLNPDTADMYYFCDPTPAGNVMHPTLIIVEKHLHSRLPEYDKGDIPCWSLGALLELMPASIEEVKDHNVDLTLGHMKDMWYLAYFDWTGLQHGHNINSDTLIKTAFEMVCWLLENDYIKKGE